MTARKRKPKIRIKAHSRFVPVATGRESIAQAMEDIRASQHLSPEEADKVLAQHVKGYAAPQPKPAAAEPVLTQAEIKALTQPKKEETWRQAFAGLCADLAFIAGCTVAFILLVDLGIMGVAGFQFATGLLDKAQQWHDQ